ncbi:MAG: HlyC/CorC family transporter [Desulfovibrionaceae bacterium]|nr:HlyC/CorC family transporter [Desulfovibrionaceae bacterium]
MDGESHSGLWTKISSLFSHKNEDYLEQAILEARAEGDLKAEEGSMLLSILTLDELQVQDIMTPRTDIDCLPAGTPIVEAARAIGDTGHSRLPIYQDTRDNIIGIVYAKDMLASLLRTESHSEPVESIMRPPFFVPETKISSELLQEFRSRKNHLAIVVDEYGGTSGLATIEDLLEVIVGDIEDEHDAPREEDIRPLPDGGYELSGRACLEDLAPLGMAFESDEVDTIGGYLSLDAGHVPQQGESFSLDGWIFTVASADAKQIHTVRARRADAGPAPAEAQA